MTSVYESATVIPPSTRGARPQTRHTRPSSSQTPHARPYPPRHVRLHHPPNSAHGETRGKPGCEVITMARREGEPAQDSKPKLRRERRTPEGRRHVAELVRAQQVEHAI